MLNTLHVGMTQVLKFTIGRAHTVPHLYPESPEFQEIPEIFATGYMIGLMEWCCIQSLAPALEAGEGSLGTAINVTHVAATPPGSCVTVLATIQSIVGRQIRWRVTAHDEIDLIGEGEIERTFVHWGQFSNKLDRKIATISSLENSNN